MLVKNLMFLLILSLATGGIFAAESEKLPEPPGTVIDKSPDFRSVHVGSPSFEMLPNGTWLASHDWFGQKSPGNRTVVFESKDKGKTWKKLSTIPDQRSGMLFYNNGAIWTIGWASGAGTIKSSCIVIHRSMDNGKTWSEVRDSKQGLLLGQKGKSYFCDPAPVLIHNGRIWKEVEQINPREKSKRNWATGFYPLVVSAPADADLLDASSWTFSNPVPWVSQPGLGGWLEGNVLFTPDDEMIIQMRVDDIKNCGKAAVINLSKDGKKASFDSKTGFIVMPGGCKKFVIRYDEAAKKYWSLVNWVHPADVDHPDKERVRNTLALVSSEDLKNWEIKNIVLRHEDTTKGFQYVDWRIDGDDLVFVCRMAWEGAPNCHDANYLTFHRLKNFRTLTRDNDAKAFPVRKSGKNI